MILFGKAILAEVPGAKFVGEVKCSQAMYDELARAGGQRRDVEGRPLADQGAHEGDRRAARRRDERPHLLRAPLARLRRRHLRRRAPARAAVARHAHARRARRRAAGDDQHAGDPHRLRRRPQVRGRRRGHARARARIPTCTGVVDIDGVRAKFARRLGPGARVEHAAGAGDALRGRDRRAARGDPREHRGARSQRAGRTSTSGHDLDGRHRSRRPNLRSRRSRRHEPARPRLFAGSGEHGRVQIASRRRSATTARSRDASSSAIADASSSGWSARAAATPIAVGVGIAAMLRDRRGTVAQLAAPALARRRRSASCSRRGSGPATPLGVYNDVNAITWGEAVAGAGARLPRRARASTSAPASAAA